MLFPTEQLIEGVRPQIPVQVLPGNTGLNTFTFFMCYPEPNSQLRRSDYVSRWTIPSGATFTYLVPNAPGFERYRVVQGQGDVGQGVRELTLLFMENLTYQDSGNYTCEVRSHFAQSPWFSASVELQLGGKDMGIYLDNKIHDLFVQNSISSSELAGQCEQCDCTYHEQ